MNEKSEVDLFALPLHPGMLHGKESHALTRCVEEQPHDLGPIDIEHLVTTVKVDEEQHCSHRSTIEILTLYDLLLLLQLPYYSSAKTRGTHEGPCQTEKEKGER